MNRLIILLAFLALPLATACFADGKEILGPWDPRYQAACIDSTATEPDMYCQGRGGIRITIPNPLYKPPVVSQP